MHNVCSVQCPYTINKLRILLHKIALRYRSSTILTTIHFTGRIKSLNSLVGKMNKDGVTDVREIIDIVGLRVTLQTTTDIKRFRRAFQHLFNRNVTEIRCYGTCGPDVGHKDKRLKVYWPWKGSGYRRLHFKVTEVCTKRVAKYSHQTQGLMIHFNLLSVVFKSVLGKEVARRLNVNALTKIFLGQEKFFCLELISCACKLTRQNDCSRIIFLRASSLCIFY